MIEWKDGTSYSQGKDRKQRCWKATIGPLSLSVMNHHIHYPNEWVMTLWPSLIEARSLGDDIQTEDLKRAQERALKLARAYLEPAWKALDSAVSSIY